MFCNGENGIDDSLLFFFLLLVVLFCGFGNGLVGGVTTSDGRCRC